MVVGLVILLWINNYFTPPVMAGILRSAISCCLRPDWRRFVTRDINLPEGAGVTFVSCDAAEPVVLPWK